MEYLTILGRQPEISVAELEALGCSVEAVYSSSRKKLNFVQIYPNSALLSSSIPQKTAVSFKSAPTSSNFNLSTQSSNALSIAKISTPDGSPLDINRLGGTQKLAILLDKTPLEILESAPKGKLTFGISEFPTPVSKNNILTINSSTPVKSPNKSRPKPSKSTFSAKSEALRLKRQLVKQGRSARIVEGPTGVISTATNLHNGLSGKNPRKIEFIHFQNSWYRVTGVQDIDAYAKRDQKRPARDAKIGMLPPKLAQILLNLAGALPPHSRILDPFCGTGVVLQEALLMGYEAYGTDLDLRMVEYSQKNLAWLLEDPEAGFLGHSGANGRGLAPFARNDGPNGRGPKNPASGSYEVCEADARTSFWKQPLDAIVTEGYLGKPFSTIPTEIELKTEIQAVKPLILAFLKNLASQIKPNTPVILAAPAWLRENGQYFRLNILDEIADLGYNVGDKTREGLLYHRSGQVVARDIIILRKK